MKLPEKEFHKNVYYKESNVKFSGSIKTIEISKIADVYYQYFRIDAENWILMKKTVESNHLGYKEKENNQNEPKRVRKKYWFLPKIGCFESLCVALGCR